MKSAMASLKGFQGGARTGGLLLRGLRGFIKVSGFILQLGGEEFHFPASGLAFGASGLYAGVSGEPDGCWAGHCFLLRMLLLLGLLRVGSVASAAVSRCTGVVLIWEPSWKKVQISRTVFIVPLRLLF
ncbi:hypothetical protein NDU88_003485 [Pleurodeles waltl]|uniref:Uncharacterized protein n=1 Tax=Pleurodeles waltl TaxID=8319 RepID=A0AAV7T4T1_PLEWA|nr:hypothetical protein NDU88_003485 [Pleurodeles waltl]